MLRFILCRARKRQLPSEGHCYAKTAIHQPYNIAIGKTYGKTFCSFTKYVCTTYVNVKELMPQMTNTTKLI